MVISVYISTIYTIVVHNMLLKNRVVLIDKKIFSKIRSQYIHDNVTVNEYCINAYEHESREYSTSRVYQDKTNLMKIAQVRSSLKQILVWFIRKPKQINFSESAQTNNALNTENIV